MRKCVSNDNLLIVIGDDYPGHSAVSEGNVQLLGMLLVEGHCGVDDQDQYGATAAHKGT